MTLGGSLSALDRPIVRPANGINCDNRQDTQGRKPDKHGNHSRTNASPVFGSCIMRASGYDLPLASFQGNKAWLWGRSSGSNDQGVWIHQAAGRRPGEMGRLLLKICALHEFPGSAAGSSLRKVAAVTAPLRCYLSRQDRPATARPIAHCCFGRAKTVGSLECPVNLPMHPANLRADLCI
jgi:hypothetical protein